MCMELLSLTILILKYAVIANDKLSIKYYKIKLEFVDEEQIKREL